MRELERHVLCWPLLAASLPQLRGRLLLLFLLLYNVVLLLILWYCAVRWPKNNVVLKIQKH